jgi:predicted pyridoxine 5'-phosphate oxidase superfamily flavin-nucleotide-binding protein
MMIRTKIIAAVILAAMTATPAMACTDWKAVAAFDAVIAANDLTIAKEDQSNTQGIDLRNRNPNPVEKQMINRKAGDDVATWHHCAEVRGDRAAALADTCQENAR